MAPYVSNNLKESIMEFLTYLVLGTNKHELGVEFSLYPSNFTEYRKGLNRLLLFYRYSTFNFQAVRI